MKGESGMGESSLKQIWLYGRSQLEMKSLLEQQAASGNTILGCSLFAPHAAFPLAGLVPAMQESIRGNLDELLLSDAALLNYDVLGQAVIEAFIAYGVLVRSASSAGSSNS